MTDTLEPLIRDLVQWCAREPRPYGEALDAWRTSCPRLMVWEEAVGRGLVETRAASAGLAVVATAKGRALLATAAGLAPVRAPVAARRPPA
jgi:hypothetical protein